MIPTREEWAKLTPEEKNRMREQWGMESKEEKSKKDEARRFVEMNLIVKAEQGEHYEPTEQARHMVKKMAAFGIPMKNIAEVIGVGVTSLQKYFQNELESGHTEANFMVANTLFQKAMGGDTTSLIFWCKTRLGWRDGSMYENASNKGEAGVLAKISGTEKKTKSKN